MKTLILAAALALTQFVDPFIGTGGHGHTFPGATYPFGMIQLSPDTRPSPGDWDGCSGYHYSDSLIYGFSHTHLSGTGCDDWCDVLMTPVVNYDSGIPIPELYRSTFSHSREKASPGYYEVFLDKPQVLVKLTADLRIGIHEYTFPDGVEPEVIIDLKHRDQLLESDLRLHADNNHIITGYRRSSSWAKDQHLFFAIEFSRQIRGSSVGKTGAVLKFAPRGKHNVLTARVSISTVSAGNALQNLINCEGDGFKRTHKLTVNEWEKYLSSIECPYTDDTHKRIFYTALYHTGIHPSLYNDPDGSYRVSGARMIEAGDWSRYTVFSLWDTFRGEHPLLSMISPQLTLDFLNSFLCVFAENGKLPVWELSGNETNCMIGYNSAPVVADALARGIDGFDVDTMLKALVQSSNLPEFGMDSFRKNGLVLADDEHESVSKTLEYAYDDWCVAQVARWLMEHPDRTTITNLQEIYSKYMTSSQYWRNVFDPQTGFMRARLNGRWVTPFDPREVNNHYTEANSWQYSFSVPHDVVGLMRAMGGTEAFCEKLDSLFGSSSVTTGRTQADITGLIGQYAHGNEPSQHIPYLYALAGQPEKTEKIVNQILETLYTDKPDGLCGNDDCGQMSAWYVLSSTGNYPVCPGTTGNHLTMVPKTIVTNPWFEYDNDFFEKEMEVSIGGEGVLWYRIGDGEFQRYSGPFTVTDDCTLEAYGEMGGRRSFVTRAQLHRIAGDKSVEIHARYNRQYTAGGDDGLIDGRRGKLNWRTGGWQGYQGQDFEAVVDLKEARTLKTVSAGFCQDARSWIWMPRYVTFSVSADGENYTNIARVLHTIDEKDYDVQVVDFTAEVPESAGPVRYVKVFAKKYGTIPEWHPGAGGEGFIFIDEITVE